MVIIKLLKKIKKRLYSDLIILSILLFKNNKNNVFFVFTPTHSNLGDHAITISTINLLKDLKLRYKEISIDSLYLLNSRKKLNILNNNPIIINGGGNLGTIWIGFEELIRKIIVNNPNSKIIIMPNSIFYEENDFGQEELKKSIEIYNNHKDLKIYAREKLSYNFMKDKYNKVDVFPDMVFYLNEYKSCDRDNLCLLCMRNDREKTISEENKITIEKNIKNIFGNNYKYTNTSTGINVPINKRKERLNLKFDEFRKASLVITDRLHGFVFCLITGTPCIIVNSKSPKVKGCYEWIKDCEYIKFADNIEDIPKLWEEIKGRNYIYDNKKFQNYFIELKENVLSFLEKNTNDKSINHSSHL